MAECKITENTEKMSRRLPIRTQKTLPSCPEDYQVTDQKPPSHPKSKALRKRLTRTDTITFGGPLEMIVPPASNKNQDKNQKPNPPIRIESPEGRSASKKESFAGFVKKNMSNIKKLAGIKYIKRSSSLLANASYSSCPNLNEQIVGPGITSKFGLSKSSEAQLYRRSSKEMASDGIGLLPGSTKLLVVPDLFTTSYTYSTDKNVPESGSSHPPTRHSSAPAKLAGQRNINQTQLNTKQSLKKSLSDNPYPRKFITESPLPSEAPLTEFRSEAIATEIIHRLYLGNIESAYNERLLCRLNISSLVDMSGLTPEEVPASKKCEVPCLCPSSTKHARARLCVNITESYGEDVEDDFEQINKFVEGGRSKGRGVLVLCFTGTNAAAAVVIQYLMQCQGMQLRKAYNKVMKKYSNLDLSPYFQHKLEVLEQRLFPEDPPSMHFRQKLVKADSLVPKEAWTEC